MDPTVILRNQCYMRLLERIARRFNQEDVPLMALKGAALNLLLPGALTGRSMSDLDLLVRPEHVDTARVLLEDVGCLRGAPLVREDFFPQFCYETEYKSNTLYPMRIDLHVRPFRPLRYARIVAEGLLWDRAEAVAVGEAAIFVPSREDMLIHLAVHVAVHGFSQAKWTNDIRQWIEINAQRIDWERFITQVMRSQLKLPVSRAMRHAKCDAHIPKNIRAALAAGRSSWRDHLALWHAPRDASHPVTHVFANVICTPGWRFVAQYLRAMILPDRSHMEDWYHRRHFGWLGWAHFLRCCWPVVRHVPRVWTWFTKIEVRPSGIHGVGVFATRSLKPAEVVARCHGKVVVSHGGYVGWLEKRDDRTEYWELTGPLKFLNHRCQPNAQLTRSALIALRAVRAGEEITIDYGGQACDCRREADAASCPPISASLVEAA